MERIPEKRKKRKTRKCLNEMRNRSKRIINGTYFEKGFQGSSQRKRKKSIVTMNRLTLAMFPKAIRSETITRPILAELKQKQNVDLKDFLKDDNLNTIIPRNLNILCNSINNIKGINSVKNNILSISDYEQNSEKVINNVRNMSNSETSSSFILFSPTSPKHRTPSLSEIVDATNGASSSSLSLQKLHGDYRHQIYEEFMNEIPSYFRRLNPVNKEEIIKNSVIKLRKLYVDSSQNECEEYLSHCLDRHTATKMSHCNRDTALGDYADDVPRGQAVPAATGSVSSVRAALSPPTASRDTPEYHYYPHKLN